MQTNRASRTPFAQWWWTIDHGLLLAALFLLIGGLILSLAASPPVAERLGLSSHHFVIRHAVYAPAAALLMVAVSFLNGRQIRRLSLIILVLGIFLMIAVLFVGPEIKGSRRWLYIAGLSIQPSELVKPAFIVIVAWLFAEGTARPEVPGRLLAIILLLIVAALVIAEPDLGQTALYFAVWGALFFLAGVPTYVVAALGLISACGIVMAYFMFPHVANRIDRFLDPSSGDTFQVDTALESFRRGGWAGAGPGEGVMKRVLPDSHTDFVFAVVAEEFGIILCLGIIALYVFLILRGLLAAFRRVSAFERLAVAGLITQIGLQAFINMGVNLQLLPAKGMTLPFISYGGSAMLSAGLAMGFALALSRRSAENKSLVHPAGTVPAGPH